MVAAFVPSGHTAGLLSGHQRAAALWARPGRGSAAHGVTLERRLRYPLSAAKMSSTIGRLGAANGKEQKIAKQAMPDVRAATLLVAMAAAVASWLNPCAPCSTSGYAFAGLLVHFSLMMPFRRAPPSPAEIMAEAPPRVCGGGAGGGTGKKVGEAVKRELDALIRDGTELGVSVTVYLEGKELASVVGGVFQPVQADDGNDGWRPVTEETLFMSYSVVKGVAATALLTCVDAGEVSYSQHVSSIWPDFAEEGKEKVSVADAVSHRAGVPDVPLGAIPEHLTGQGPGDAWELGVMGVEEAKPKWTPGTKASYHYISFSWLIGGIIEYATKGESCGGIGFRRVVEERVASRIGSSGEMFVGGVLPARLQHASRLVPPPTYALPPDPSAPAPLLFLKRILAAVECRIFVAAGNSRRWRDVCLPSSNGWFTSRSVARMYAALVNGGRLSEEEGGNRLVSDKSANLVLNVIGDKNFNVASAKGEARLSCGFSPWINPEIHAPEDDQVTINANGMGGCVSFGESPSGLAVCVMKNSYEPIIWAGGSVTPTAERVVAAVRRVLQETTSGPDSGR